MLKKLRRNFMLINMSLVCIVLAVVLSAQIAGNYRQIQITCNSALEMALKWGDDGPSRWEMGSGHLPAEPRELLPDEGAGIRFRDEFGAIIPTVCVTLDGSGAITKVIDNNVDISDEVLAAAVEEALSSGGESGTLSGLDLRYQRKAVEDGDRIAFADRTWERSETRTALLTGLTIFVGAFLGFLVVSFFLSRWATAPVEKSWQQQQQFVADASHELKTPLTVMLADTNILLSHPEQTIAEQRKWVEYIQDEAQRMKQLVEDMLFLTRSDNAVQRDLVYTDVALSDLAWGCLLSFEPVAFEQGVTLVHDVEHDLRVLGDGEQLRRLMVILLDNACKYAGRGGTVTLWLKRTGEKVQLAVHNTGAPIPPEDQIRLFERFYRADAARDRKAGGYGLGLSIAQSIVWAHQGKITVSSTAEAGTTFTVILPAA